MVKHKISNKSKINGHYYLMHANRTYISFYTTIHTTASLIRETNLRLPVTETKLVGPRVLYASY